MLKRLLQRIVPDSLLGQLVLTFTVSFMAFLLISMLHAHQSRTFYSVRGILSFRSRNMVEIALLMDNAAPAQRHAMAERMSLRGMSIFTEDIPPTFDSITPPQFAKEAGLMTRLLNAFMEEVWNPGLFSEASYDSRMERVWDETDPHYMGPGQAAILSMNSPRFMDDVLQSLKRSAGRKAEEQKDIPALYEAIVAIPLSDGSWVIFQDRVPGRSSLPPLPLKGILFTEIFFILISLFAFYHITKPLRNMTRAADNMGRDIAGAPPLSESGPREVREGAQAFNRMQRRIRSFVDQRSSTLAAVSHDLRTPLTRMRLRVEKLEEKDRAPLQKDMDALQQLVDTALDLSRSGTHEPSVNLDITSFIESIVEDRQDMGQNIHILSPESLAQVVPLLAPPQTIRRCLNNILDNAVRYGGGKVDIEVEDSKTGIVIAIHDYGSGIPEKDLEKVFEPFFRLEPSRNRSTGGSGLGLGITRTMLHACGGDIVLENRHPKPEKADTGGLTARLSFPRNRSEAI